MQTNDSRPINIASEIATSRLTAAHYKALLFIVFITLFDGYDTINPAFVIHYVVGPWHIPKEQIGLLIASGLFGFLFGSLFSGIIADRLGRKPTFVGALILAGIFSILTGVFADSFWVFNGLRVATGLGLGVLMPLGTTYINEMAPRRYENSFSVLGPMGFSLGAIVASLIGAFLTPHFGWRLLYYIGGTAILLALVAQVWLDESPRFMGLNQQAYRARLVALMKRLNPARASVYDTADLYIGGDDQDRRGDVRALFRPRYRRNTILIWVIALLLLFDLYGYAGWLPEIMIGRGLGLATSFLFGAIFQASGIAGGFALSWFADRFIGRRYAFSLLALAAAVDGWLFLVFPHSPVANMVLAFLAGFCVVGGMFVLNNFTAQTYDTEVRATGQGMELGIGRIGGVLGPYILGLLALLGQRDQVFFVTISVVGLLLAVLMLMTRPEKLGRREEEGVAEEEPAIAARARP